MRFLSPAIPLCVAALAVAAPALAQDCKPPVLATSADLMPTGDGRMLVPVAIDGLGKKMLLDTAGGLTTMTQNSVDALGLHRTQQGIRALDANGFASRLYVHVDSLQLGGLRANKLTLMITPDRTAGTSPAYDGVLAPDAMDRYDVEMDFAAHKLNYFSQDHCPGYVVYWQAPAGTTVPFTMRNRLDRPPSPMPGENLLIDDPNMSVGAHLNASGVFGIDIKIPVTLDGKAFMAQLDTGTASSTLNSASARAAFDVTADSPGSRPVASVNPVSTSAAGETVTVNGARLFDHVFHTLSFGGVSVINPHFIVRRDLIGDRDPDNDSRNGSHIERVDDGLEPEITIGMDVLSRLHLYFAFGEGKLYITAAAPQQNAAAQ